MIWGSVLVLSVSMSSSLIELYLIFFWELSFFATLVLSSIIVLIVNYRAPQHVPHVVTASWVILMAGLVVKDFCLSKNLTGGENQRTEGSILWGLRIDNLTVPLLMLVLFTQGLSPRMSCLVLIPAYFVFTLSSVILVSAFVETEPPYAGKIALEVLQTLTITIMAYCVYYVVLMREMELFLKQHQSDKRNQLLLAVINRVSDGVILCESLPR